jgi:nitrite reductase/ring-hydroxylating ferredoxin subunit
MRIFRRTSRVPLWRDEFPVRTADERYVTRRQFSRFLVLTSLGMLVGNLWILLRTRWKRDPAAPVPVVVARVGEIPIGGVKVFRFPGPADPCLLLRTREDVYVAYSQKCTHLSCAVYYAHERNRLECPCHEGYFAVEDGRVIQGPPPRPLPRILIEVRGAELVAVGFGPGPRA